jgi:hypothetical protein
MLAHTTGCPPVAQREDPGRPPGEVADVLRHYGATYRATHHVPPSHHKVMHDIMVCRTAALGGHAEQCPQCGFERYAYNSCRNRHCPTCQTMTKAQWVADRQAELLPVPYFHCVFTLPHELNALVLVNKRPLLTRLLQATSQTLLQFGRQNLGGQRGGIPILPTWDQTLGAHFHVHCLGPGGALGENGTRWVPTHPRFLFPVHALSTVFRGTCLDALLSRTPMGPLVVPEETETLATPEGFRRCIDQLYTKAWIVYAKQSMGGPGPVLDYLSRYTHRVAIANPRIVDVQDGQVRFTYRNRRQGNRVQTMTLEAHEFIRRFLLHIVPQRLQRMRHMGFLANRCKARALRQCRHLLNQPPDPPTRPVQSVAEWLWQWTGTDITRCPECGQGPLLRLPLPPLPPSHPFLPPLWDSS